MLFTINEINNRADVLPGLMLGYRIYDSCNNILRSVKLVLALTDDGDEESASDEKSCAKPAQVQAIIGEGYSSPSMATASIIGPFHVPVVSRMKILSCKHKLCVFVCSCNSMSFIMTIV